MASFRRIQVLVPSLARAKSNPRCFNVRKHKIGTLDRRIFEAVTQPILAEQVLHPGMFCNRMKEEKEQTKQQENLYEQFLIRECKKMLDKSYMVIAFQILSTNGVEKRQLRNKLFWKNLHVVDYFSNSILKQSVADSKYENLRPLFVGNNYLVASDELRMSELVKISKKVPFITMLGGLVGDKILNREELLAVASLPGLDYVRGELVSILNSSASRTHQLLNSHQQTLTTSLEQYIKDQENTVKES